MLDFEIRRFGGRCAETGRDFTPGESFFSTLVMDGGELVRRDYCADSWQGPPNDVLGWWKSQVPDPKSRKVHWAPNDVMLHSFTQTQENGANEDLRYILALLLVRRRVFRLQETETDERGRPVMVVYCPRDQNEYHVPEVTLTPQREKEIQNELASLLFAKADG